MRSSMRSFALAVVLVAAWAAWFPGCKNADDGLPGPSNAVPTRIVADLAAAALGGGSATQGIAAQLEGAAVYAGGGNFPKRAGEADIRPFDTTIVRDGGNGWATYHYEFTYSISVTNFGNRMSILYSMRGTFDTPRMSSVDSANGSITFDHIIDADTVYLVNSAYTRRGTQQSKVDEELEFTSTITSSLTDVRISKATNQIVSGAGTMTVSGELSTGGSFSYTVSVLFLGSQQAMLTVNGVSYMANLAVGTATPVVQ